MPVTPTQQLSEAAGNLERFIQDVTRAYRLANPDDKTEIANQVMMLLSEVDINRPGVLTRDGVDHFIDLDWIPWFIWPCRYLLTDSLQQLVDRYPETPIDHP
jgi:hypothetical protein